VWDAVSLSLPASSISSNPPAQRDGLTGSDPIRTQIRMSSCLTFCGSIGRTCASAGIFRAVAGVVFSRSEELRALETPRVGYLIYRLERRLRARLDRAVSVHGVTTTEYVTLSVLREQDGLSSAELARLALVTPQAMNLVISALERRELVARRPHPEHGRVLRTSVTELGLAALSACDRDIDVIEAQMLGDLDPATLEVVRTALRSCAHALEQSASSEREQPAG
jgi:DNA-binding MarR family transcriptional regulator